MFYFLLVIHIIISAILILLILTQSSKGNALEGMVGSAATNMMGSDAGNFFKKWTRFFGLAFLASCIVLALNVQSKPSTSTKALDKARKQIENTVVPNAVNTDAVKTTTAPEVKTEKAEKPASDATKTTAKPADNTKK